MAYTPELSYKSSCTLRRIAWALGMPMTEAIDWVFEHLPKVLDKEKWKDNRPFIHKLFGDFLPPPKQKTNKSNEKKDENDKDGAYAKRVAWGTYRYFKKSHRMITW